MPLVDWYWTQIHLVAVSTFDDCQYVQGLLAYSGGHYYIWRLFAQQGVKRYLLGHLKGHVTLHLPDKVLLCHVFSCATCITAIRDS